MEPVRQAFCRRNVPDRFDKINHWRFMETIIFSFKFLLALNILSIVG